MLGRFLELTKGLFDDGVPLANTFVMGLAAQEIVHGVGNEVDQVWMYTDRDGLEAIKRYLDHRFDRQVYAVRHTVGSGGAKHPFISIRIQGSPVVDIFTDRAAAFCYAYFLHQRISLDCTNWMIVGNPEEVIAFKGRKTRCMSDKVGMHDVMEVLDQGFRFYEDDEVLKGFLTIERLNSYAS